MSRLIIVSNRVPVADGRSSMAGGLATGLKDALKSRECLWFGWSGELRPPGEELRVQKKGNITYATLPLSRQDYREYYCNHANNTLWPAFHYRIDLARYDKRHYDTYCRVNERFARQLSTLLQPDDTIWVHDYHLIPFARYCRQLGVRNRIGFFLHTPFPVAEILTTIPCHRELIADLNTYDLVGFHTEDYRQAFIDALKLYGRTRNTSTGVFPLGVSIDDIQLLADSALSPSANGKYTVLANTQKTIISVDRLDYSKGLGERFDAYQCFLERFPHYHHRIQMLQIASPSREDILNYQASRHALEQLTGHINGCYSDLNWQPLRYINKTYDRQTLMGVFRRAQVGFVAPLRDGMNLVAKEYVAAQSMKSPGVLVLSQFAGAAREMDAAILVNPYDREAVAKALDQALSMPLPERIERQDQLIRVLRQCEPEQWSSAFLDRLCSYTRNFDELVGYPGTAAIDTVPASYPGIPGAGQGGA